MIGAVLERLLPAARRVRPQPNRNAFVPGFAGPADWRHFQSTRQARRPAQDRAPLLARPEGSSARIPGAPGQEGKVLIVLERRATGERLATHLAREGFAATIVAEPAELDAAIAREPHAVVVTKTELIDPVRRFTNLPIVNLEVFVRHVSEDGVLGASQLRFDGRAFMNRLRSAAAFA